MLSFVCHAQSAFKSFLNHNSPESRFLPILWSSLMTDFWHKKTVLSIAGAKVQKF